MEIEEHSLNGLTFIKSKKESVEVRLNRIIQTSNPTMIKKRKDKKLLENMREMLKEELFNVRLEASKLKKELNETNYQLSLIRDSNKLIRNSVYTIQDVVEEQTVVVRSIDKTCSDNQKQLEAVRQFLELDNREPYGYDDWFPPDYDHSISKVIKKVVERT